MMNVMTIYMLHCYTGWLKCHQWTSNDGGIAIFKNSSTERHAAEGDRRVDAGHVVAREGVATGQRATDYRGGCTESRIGEHHEGNARSPRCQVVARTRNCCLQEAP